MVRAEPASEPRAAIRHAKLTKNLAGRVEFPANLARSAREIQKSGKTAKETFGRVTYRGEVLTLG